MHFSPQTDMIIKQQFTFVHRPFSFSHSFSQIRWNGSEYYMSTQSEKWLRRCLMYKKNADGMQKLRSKYKSLPEIKKHNLTRHSLVRLRNRIRIDSQQRNCPMIQKMGRAQHRSIPAYGNHQVDISQMLPVQFDAVDTRKGNVVAAKDVQEIVDAFFMWFISIHDYWKNRWNWDSTTNSIWSVRNNKLRILRWINLCLPRFEAFPT